MLSKAGRELGVIETTGRGQPAHVTVYTETHEPNTMTTG